MSKARTVPGENLSERLSARLASRAKVGQTSEFYHRLGVENPYDTNAPAQEMADNGMFSFLSASAYYRELKSSRHRMMWRIESIRHRPVAGERLRTAGPAFARPRRETVLAAPSLHDLVYVDHDAQVDSEEQDLEATAAFPRSKRRAVTARRPVAARPMARVADKHVPAADSALDKRLNEVLATLRTSTRGDTRRALEQAVRGTGVQRDRALERVVRGVRGPVARSAARRITEARVDADQAPIAVAKARMSNERRSSRSVKGLRPVLRNSPALIALQPENNSVPVQEDAAPLAQLGRSKAQPRAQVHKTPSRRVQSPRSLAASAPVGRSNATQRSYRRVAQSVSARPTAWAAALIRPKRVDADVTVGRGMPAASPSRSRRVSSEPVPRAARRSSAGTSSSLSAAPLAGAATRWLSESLHPERAVGSRAVRSMAGATPVRRTTRLAGAMELPTAVEPVLADETPLNQTASVRSSRRKGRAPRQARASSAVGVSRGLLTVQTREIPPTLRASDRSIASQSPSLSASPVRSLRLRDSAVRAEADNGASMGRRVSARPTQGSVRSHVARPQSAAVLLSPTATATATTDVVESAPRLGSSRPIARTRPVKTQATTRAARRADRLPVTDPRGVASARPSRRRLSSPLVLARLVAHLKRFLGASHRPRRPCRWPRWLPERLAAVRRWLAVNELSAQIAVWSLGPTWTW